MLVIKFSLQSHSGCLTLNGPQIKSKIGDMTIDYIILFTLCFIVKIYLRMPSERHSVYTSKISNKSTWFQIQATTLVLEYPQLFCIFFAEHLKKIIIYVNHSSSKALTLYKQILLDSKTKTSIIFILNWLYYNYTYRYV